MLETRGLQELLRGVGDFNMGLVEAILCSHRINQVKMLRALKGEFLDEVLETAKAVSKALRLPPGLTDAITKLGENAQNVDELAAMSGSSNCGVTAFCLTAGCVTDGGATADGVTAGILTDPSGGPRRALLNPFPGATSAAKALRSLTAAEEGGMDSWRIDEALKELWESQRLASESASCAGRALVIIDEFPTPEKMPSSKDEDQPDVVIKAAKLAMRDAFMWRCMGLALGMESQVALDPIFISSYKGQARAQLIQSFYKIRDSTAKLLTGANVRVVAPAGGHAKRVRVRKEDGSCEAATQTDIAPPPGLTGPSSLSRRATLSTILQGHRAPDIVDWMQ